MLRKVSGLSEKIVFDFGATPNQGRSPAKKKLNRKVLAFPHIRRVSSKLPVCRQKKAPGNNPPEAQ